MIKKADFENVTLENLKKYSPSSKFGYEIPKSSGADKSRIFDNYYENEDFEKFLKEMQLDEYKTHYDRYKAGKGGELEIKKGKYGITPPKMASITSSSRFCYLALRNRGGAIGAYGPVTFEAGFSIEGIKGTAPQLDAWFSEDNIFVEAKCQEIFTAHTPAFKKAYWDIIYGNNNQFGFGKKGIEKGDEFLIPLSEFGIEKTKTMFDIKQFLCHILGIASKQRADGIKAKLVYLFFIPKTDNLELKAEIEKLAGELTCEIEKIFTSKPIKRFTEKNNIELAAFAEHDFIMRDLTEKNIVTLYI